MHVPLVFVTKYRRGVFNDEMLTPYRRDHADRLRGLRGGPEGVQRRTRYVHLLMHYPPKGAVSKLFNSLKGASARRMRQEFTGRINRAIMHGHLW